MSVCDLLCQFVTVSVSVDRSWSSGWERLSSGSSSGGAHSIDADFLSTISTNGDELSEVRSAGS